ncbi:MAG: rod shape-determining protein MreC [Opitutia bacterium]|nr:rod shape-determining protein MreC [Opitutales bacterium]PHX79494.1 MAG: rod shape-determining protein MreC [Opitutae bacterium]
MEANRQGARASYVALAIFVAVWILLPSAARRFTREAFVEFQAPALHLVGKSRDLATFWEKKSRSVEEMAAAGRDLARVNAALELKLSAFEDVRRENVRLREIARYNVPPEYLSVIARVATRDSSSWWQRIVIRKGRNDGIRPGAPVVFGNVVVGRVTTVHLTTSEVDLVTSPGFRCTAYLEGDEQNRIVLVHGVASNSLGTAKARVSVIPRDYSMPAGQPARVLTTGMGGVFPSRLTLGNLDGMTYATQVGNFSESLLVPSRDLYNLQEVSVLVPLHPNPGEALMQGDQFQ